MQDPCRVAAIFFSHFQSYVALTHQVLPSIISVEDPQPFFWDNKNKTKKVFIQTWNTFVKGLIAGAVAWKVWFTEMPPWEFLFSCSDR